MENKWTICCGAPQFDKLRGISGTARPWSAYPAYPAVIDGEAIGTSQAIVLDPDAPCLDSGTEKKISTIKKV